MNDHQFNQILEGSQIASEEKLHRLGGLLTAVLSVSQEPSEPHLAALYEAASKVGGDLAAHKRKTAS